jgi:C4-dicarboxylate-specific signal transduction histidine kinase
MALIDNGGVVIISSRPQARHVIVTVFETQQRHDTHTALQCDEPHISNQRHASANLKDADAVQRVELVDQSSAHQGHLGRSYKICSGGGGSGGGSNSSGGRRYCAARLTNPPKMARAMLYAMLLASPRQRWGKSST